MSALQELQNYTFISKYARWIESEQRRETWKEAVNRVRNMMLLKYADKDIEHEINWAYDFMLKKKVLGSQRALQFGGQPALKKNARIYNCVSSFCDRPRFFQEMLWLLLCGCGTGFSVQKHHVAKLPGLKDHSGETHTYQIPDTIEGWADALGILMTTYFTEPAEDRFDIWTNRKVKFDFSAIRPEGSPLSSGVGKAPGPKGLKLALMNIQLLLDRAIKQRQEKLRPIDTYDIGMHSADAVLSGGVRRSATIAIFSPDDQDMLTAKIGNWDIENPQRARSNNSAMLIRGDVSYDQFLSIVEHTKEYGEPGFYWSDSTECIPNPCVEISFWPVDVQTGLSGWQGCNLSTINAATIKSIEDFEMRGEAATIIGTLQAGFTDQEYLGAVSERIFKREALLGVSMTGIMDQFDIVLNPENQKRVVEHIRKTNKFIADKIGINYAARLTCVKPEGTGSNVLGTLACGVHAWPSARLIRYVQANALEEPFKHFKNTNPQACVKSKWAANDTDQQIMFPIEIPDGSKTKNQLPAITMLEIVKSTQQNWVMPGKNPELCTQPWLQHNVSNTVTVKPDEWDEVAKYIYDNNKFFAGVSLLSDSGDKDYTQAPFTSVYTAKEIAKQYGDPALWCSGLIELALDAFNNDLWAACDFALQDKVYVTSVLLNFGEPNKNGDIFTRDSSFDLSDTLQSNSKKMRFVGKMNGFAAKYFNGDMKRLTYCMKDVYNWKLYCDLKSTFSPVDYTTMVENTDNTQHEAEAACANGMCLI